jgi:hypothetical protein
LANEVWITCPKCKMTSHNPHDIEQGYCGNCHMFHADMRPKKGWWNMACFNALSPAQQQHLVTVGVLPFGYRPEGGTCLNGAEVGVETQDDKFPGPRFYCLSCAIAYLEEKSRQAALPTS